MDVIKRTWGVLAISHDATSKGCATDFGSHTNITAERVSKRTRIPSFQPFPDRLGFGR
jgi:hypothetical protein